MDNTTTVLPIDNSFLSKCKRYIVNNPTMILYSIIILIAVVIYLYTFYHGFWVFGPYAPTISTEENEEIDEIIAQLNRTYGSKERKHKN